MMMLHEMPHGIILSRRTGRGGLLSATSENSGAGESSAADREWEPLNGIQVLKSALKHWVSLGAYGFWQYTQTTQIFLKISQLSCQFEPTVLGFRTLFRSDHGVRDSLHGGDSHHLVEGVPAAAPSRSSLLAFLHQVQEPLLLLI